MRKCCNKNCAKRGQLQPFENFYRDKNHSSGYQRECKVCTKERQDKAPSKSFVGNNWLKMFIG